MRVLCFGSEKSGKAEKNGQAQNQNINLAERWDQLQSDFLMYSPSGRIAAPTHRMSWQGGDGTKSAKWGRGRGDGRQEVRRRNEGQRQIDKYAKEGRNTKGEGGCVCVLVRSLIAFIYAYAVIWPQNHSPKKKICA